ncbi:hypothetical protein BdWA1_001967 [Babesia duncani]|uniref:Uncharacterized protein n=1 Tax=Babesia duncani TaxID=323732 RepID=A0AAD9UP42_9APIC|nr:hypothetical protein BdWA1_001967 [Babesia duncani]
MNKRTDHQDTTYTNNESQKEGFKQTPKDHDSSLKGIEVNLQEISEESDFSGELELQQDVEDMILPQEKLNSMLKGFSRAFKTSTITTPSVITKTDDPEKGNTQKVKKTCEFRTVHMSPADGCLEMEEKYRKIANRGVRKLFELLNQS